MNLIEIQDKLRSLPVQVLQQYANGSNPEVPPYVALGVLQEKQAMAQRMGNIQGASQGQMPTVKDKVEQASGLLGLQMQKQQQAAQQAAAQNMNRPSPVPAGVRPAEGQPTASEAVPMRAGGLARLRSGLNLARGGIVAFQDGGNVSLMKIKEEIRRRNPALTPDEVERMAINQMQRYDEQGKFVPYMQREGRGEYGSQPNFISDIASYLKSKMASAPQTREEMDRQRMRDVQDRRMTPTTTSGQAMSIGDIPEIGRRRAEMSKMAQTNTVADADAAIAANRQAEEAKASAPKSWNEPAAFSPPAAPAQKPPVQAGGIAGAAPKQAAAPQAPAATQGPQGIQKALEAMRGIREASGRGASQYDPQIQSKMDEMSRAYEESKKTRDFENMLRFLGGSAKGPTGQVEAYLQNMQSGRALDAAERDRQLKAMQGLQAQEQARAAEFETGTRSLYDRQLTNEGSMATAELNAKTQLEGDRIRAQATRDAAAIAATARENANDIKSIQQAEAAFARDPNAVAIRKKMEDPLTSPEEVMNLQKQLNAIQIQKYRAFGVNVEGAQESSDKNVQMPPGVKVTKIG